MQITFVRSNTNAVGEYRIKHPMLAMRSLGHTCRLITLDKTPQRVANTELAGDVLVLQRQTAMDSIELARSLPASQRPIFVYECDDNPWEWHPWDPIHVELGHEYGRRVREVMGQCRAITCSTPVLAARIRAEFPKTPIWVVPNAIDYNIRDWQAKEDRAEFGLSEKVVLGWTGSLHHARDGQALLKALPEVLERYGEAVFLMQCDKSVYQAWTRWLPVECNNQLRWVPPLAFDWHPRIYSLFDINLAPLETTPFNLCKSDLRLIEGGAHGVPYVASKIAPYQEFHAWSGGIGGHLAGTPREWTDGICKLIEGEREARGESLSRYIREKRSLDVIVHRWETAFREIVNGEGGCVIWPETIPGRNDLCPCTSGKKYKRCCIPAYG